jgi:hypothetical protein
MEVLLQAIGKYSVMGRFVRSFIRQLTDETLYFPDASANTTACLFFISFFLDEKETKNQGLESLNFLPA